jgi:RNA polymerase sigma factor (sigma-70 family)
MVNDSERSTSWLDAQLPTLVLLARQWVPRRSDAEDVVQEGFVRFWGARHRAEEPVAYLYACVRHAAMDWQRKRRRQSMREETVARSAAEPLFQDPLEQNERRTAIEIALRALPDGQREVLVMRIWGVLSFPQIASALGISVDTAKSRHRYALAKLREQLAEEAIHE